MCLYVVCEPACVRGVCNTTIGDCECDPGYHGLSCELGNYSACAYSYIYSIADYFTIFSSLVYTV